MPDLDSLIQRIGYLSPCWPPEQLPSGIASYVRNVAEGLRSLGVAVDTYSLCKVPPEYASDDVFDISTLLPQSDSRLSRAIDHIRRNRNMADFIASAFGSALSRAVYALPEQRRPQLLELEETFGIARWVRTPGIPMVIRLHGPWFLNGPMYGLPLDRQFRLRCASEYRAVRYAAGVSAPSRYVLNQFLGKLDAQDVPSEVIPNPVPPVPPNFLWKPPNDGVIRILYVGRFERIKGPDIALEAFALVQKRLANVEFIFAGSDNGFVDDEGHTWSIKDYLASRLAPAAASRVRFLGKVSKARLDELRRECRVGVVASRNESFSITAIEFQRAGVPTVAPAVGGIPEIIEHERTGLLFPAGESGALAEAILRLLTEDELSARLGAEGRTSSQRCDPVAVAEQSMAFYKSALIASRSP
jgi:glycosyltransferase involved in cell wall biosynthesis